jgi:hypothetical protein
MAKGRPENLPGFAAIGGPDDRKVRDLRTLIP